MKIFLTGSSGFVGREVASQLLAAGYRVVGLVRNRHRAGSRIPRGVEPHEGDILRPESYQAALDGCDAVIHLVGIIVESGRGTFEAIHVKGTEGLIESTRKAGIKRFIYMSALGSAPDARSRYHQTKFRAEERVRQSGFDWTIFRPSVIFGRSDQFANRLAGIIRSAPFIPVIGAGSARLQPISVEDVAACFCLAAGNPASHGKIYPLGGPEAFSYEQIFKLIASILKIKKRVLHIQPRLVYPAAWMMNLLLSHPPLTPEQLIMMEEDNICDSSEAVADFGLNLKPFESGIREYLVPA